MVGPDLLSWLTTQRTVSLSRLSSQLHISNVVLSHKSKTHQKYIEPYNLQLEAGKVSGYLPKETTMVRNSSGHFFLTEESSSSEREEPCQNPVVFCQVSMQRIVTAIESW